MTSRNYGLNGKTVDIAIVRFYEAYGVHADENSERMDSNLSYAKVVSGEGFETLAIYRNRLPGDIKTAEEAVRRLKDNQQVNLEILFN